MTAGTALPPTPGRLSARLTHDSAASLGAWARLGLHLAARIYRSFLLTLLVVAAVPLALNWSDHVIRSGSMEPSISVGDVVVAKPFTASEPVPVGRVMIFTNPAKPDHPELLVHRVMENLGKGSYTTAGDANVSNDTTPVTRDRFIARATLLIPFVGRPFIWWSTGDLVPLLAWTLLTTLCFVCARRAAASPRDPGTPTDEAGEPRRPRRFAKQPGRLLRTTTGRPAHGRLDRVVPVIVLVSAGTVLSLTAGSASATFTSTTRNPGSAWTVSSTLSTNLVLASPGDPVQGTVPVTATLANNYGLAFAVRMEIAPAGTTTWQTLCVDSTAPYTCNWATASVANRDYDLRAVATSGSSTYTSRVVSDVSVDNAVPSVTMQDPGTPLRGSVLLAATATDAHSGVTRVAFEYAAMGSSTWQTACTATQQPWSCSFSSALVPDGSYALRAVATDVAGNATTSAAVTNRVVDNTPPGGFDIQATNGGLTPGRLEAGDAMVLTYNEQMLPSSISSGWDGTPLAVTLRLRNSSLVGLTGKNDTVDVLRNGAAVNLGSVNLRDDYVSNNQLAQFDATMTATTTTVNGVSTTRITITLGAVTSGSTSLRTSSASPTMVWTPSDLATDLGGLAASVTAVNESGLVDRDY